MLAPSDFRNTNRRPNPNPTKPKANTHTHTCAFSKVLFEHFQKYMKQTRTSTSSHALLDEYTQQSGIARLSTSMQINTYFLDYSILVISCALAGVASITSRPRVYVQRSCLHRARASSVLQKGTSVRHASSLLQKGSCVPHSF